MRKADGHAAETVNPAALAAGLALLPLSAALLLPVFVFFCAKLLFKAWRAPEKSLTRAVISPRGLGLLFIVFLRYRLTVRGLEKIAGPGPFLFLCNHPSLLDPFLIYACLDGIRPRYIADENQFTSPLLRWVKKTGNVITIPDYTIDGPKARAGLLRGLEQAAKAMRGGEHVALFPAGFMQRAQPQKLNNNSSVSRIMQAAPEGRIIAVRVSGMWGSSFSRAAHNGAKPDFMRALAHGVSTLPVNLMFFAPRRQVEITFTEAGPEVTHLATAGGAAHRRDFTAWLEAYFNQDCSPAFRVPYYFWQGSQPVPFEAREES